jgi:tRNA threonylcarbamoyl adenosine modification protein YeaZ
MNESNDWLLALDTATTSVVVAAGTRDGRIIATDTVAGRYRHSQELLPAIAALVDRTGLRLADLAGIVVGTGPGAFTGLRVGLATAKTLAHELDRPVVGVATSDALLAAVGDPGTAGQVTLWLPSGPRDRVAVVAGRPPEVVPGGDGEPPATGGHERARAHSGSDSDPGFEPGSEPGSEPPTGRIDVAVDLEGRASEAALARGRAAVERLPATLLSLGAARLRAGEQDDPERLVPRYASQPRGAPGPEPEGGVAWSRDPR